MRWLELLLTIVVLVSGLGCLLIAAIGLPGAWILLALAAGLEVLARAWLDPAGAGVFGWTAIGIGCAVAVAGEIVEAVAGAAGARAGGASRRGIIGALLGGIVGGIALTGLIPIPIIGTLIGAMIGTFAGAVIGEVTAEQAPGTGDTLRAATGATIGRVLGTLGKTMAACAIWIVLAVAAVT